ncbi:MAG TPA: hypothetical protein VGK19_16100 [Capsulimonadaceae bacterium]|jgi:hypothetical protein
MDNTQNTNYRFRLSRLVRTQSSEIFLIWEEDKRVGQLDVHYAQDTIHATLVLEADLTPETEEELLSQIDEDVVSSYLPSFDREDFLVTVFRGEEISSYTDSSGALDDIEDDFEDGGDDDDDEEEEEGGRY